MVTAHPGNLVFIVNFDIQQSGILNIVANFNYLTMKKILVVLFLFPVIAIGQVPQAINYQGVVRDNNDLPITDQQVSIRLSIVENEPPNYEVYSEVHQATANRFGLVNFLIGTGESEGAEFDDINWSTGNYNLRVEVDPNGGINYILVGENRLVSVPYALHAETVTFNDDADADPLNERITNVFTNGNILVIQEAGNEFTVDLGDWNQTLTKNGNVITLSNGGSVIDEVEDDDADPNNELQDLTLTGTTLGITNGNTVNLSNISPWVAFNLGIYYDQGQVVVGDPQANYNVLFDDFSVNVTGINSQATLRDYSLFLYDTNIARARLGLDYLEFHDASDKLNLRLMGDPGTLVTFINGHFTSILGATTAETGILSLFNPAEQINVRLSSPMGHPYSGYLEINHQENRKVELSTDDNAAGKVYTYGSNELLNTYMGYFSTSLYTIPSIGEVRTYDNGQLRSSLSASLEAGYLSLIGPDFTNVLLYNTSGKPNSGKMSLFHENREFIRMGVNDVYQYDFSPNNSGLFELKDPDEKTIVRIASHPNIPEGGMMEIKKDNKTKISLWATATDIGIIELSGSSDDDIINLGSTITSQDAGEINLYSNDQKTMTLGINDYFADQLHTDSEKGLLRVYDSGYTRAILQASGDGPGELLLFSNNGGGIIRIGHTGGGFPNPINNTQGQNKRMQQNLPFESTNKGVISVLMDDEEKLRFDIDDVDGGNIKGYGPSNTKIFEMSPVTDQPDAGGMGFYGPGETMNSFIGVTNTDPNTGSITTLKNEEVITLLADNPGNVGTISTFEAGDGIKTQLSSAVNNNAGTITTYYNNLPHVELTSNAANTGYITTYNGEIPTIQMTTNNAGTGSIWLKNINNQYDALLGSNTNESGGYLGLYNNGLTRSEIFSGHALPGIVENYDPGGNRITLMGYQNSFPYAGSIATYNDGALRNLIANSTDVTAGYMGTYGENGSINCYLTTFANAPNGGYIGACDYTSSPRAAMYVNSSGQGILMGTVLNITMEDPEDDRQEIWYSGLAGPEAAVYIRGTAKLENGRCIVSFPDHFQKIIDHVSMTVMMTPLSAQSKGLAVVQKNEGGFMVMELFKGEGNYEFDWEVKGTRKSFENFRVRREKVRPAKGGLPANTQQRVNGGIPPQKSKSFYEPNINNKK